MKLVTWNVNSLRARLGRVEQWIKENDPDVLLMQETKCSAANFPEMTFVALGYECAQHGEGQWNGVAIVSRVGLSDVQPGFTGDRAEPEDESRLISAMAGGISVFSVYVPNGRVVGSEHYQQKLDWLARLRRELDARCSPSEQLALCGDFNVAPEDRDVWDISEFAGETHVTAPEREQLANVMDFGLSDSLRVRHPDETGPFSWWDYRAGAFHKGWGMRIDLALVSKPLLERVVDVTIDRDARKGKLPSDHAPVIVQLVD